MSQASGGQVDVMLRPKGRIWRQTDGIVRVEWDRGVTVGLPDAVDMVVALQHLQQRAPTRLLVDISQVASTQMEARAHFAGEGAGSHLVALALFAPTASSRFFANLYLMVARARGRRFPMRVFQREADALDWLAQHAAV